MRSALVLPLLLLAGPALAQGARQNGRPYIGYLCAAGGERGTTVRIVAGGQNLRGAREVIVSGEGVTGRIVRVGRTPWLLSPDERRVVAQRLRDAGRRPPGRGPDRRRNGKQPRKEGASEPDPPLPDHPMLKDLGSLTPQELRRVAWEFLDPRRRSQLSAQIAETVELEITIDPRAKQGDRELRLRSWQGITNPVLFCVGALPEVREQEPNDFRTARQPTVQAPCVVNGQVSFRDRDRFRFHAAKGQSLVIDVQARRLVPYLADAVPGWFQATLALFDAEGREIRFADDHRFDPDPVLFFEVPDDGEYTLEIRDAIHRGREDFVYRITIAERPFVLSMFPCGGRAGSSTTARIEGWNLGGEKLRLPTGRGSDEIRATNWNRSNLRTNALLYAVGELPERFESEPNDDRPRAQLVPMGSITNGRIDQPGDADWYRFHGRAGEEVAVEIHGRRLGSPLDSLVQLTDAAGYVVAWNDDHPDPSAGLVTHQADSYLRVRLLKSETYTLRVTDAQGHGGRAFTYRLRVSRPHPEFVVMVTPASVNVPSGGSAAIDVHVVRRDGFDGEIELSIPDAPRGLTLSGGRIPAGRDRMTMTIAAPSGGRGPIVPLAIEARATVGGRPVRRLAVPAEDMMQAFGLRHLVRARELLVDVTGVGRKLPRMGYRSERAIRLAGGKSAEVHIVATGLPKGVVPAFRLVDPPEGLSLGEVRASRDGFTLALHAGPGPAAPERRENLLLEARVELSMPGRRASGAKGPASRTETVLLPALPVDRIAE